MGKSGGDSLSKEKNGDFPTGMRVLAVDDDVVCLRLLEMLLVQCGYQVTATQHALRALELLRENSNNYDLVISDVQMPDMDGFKLLEIVGLEMDLPVIMLSGNGDTDIVMKGIMHGACDYLVKPARLEELRIIWKHVVKRSLHDTKEAHDQSSNQDIRRKSGDDQAVRVTGKQHEANNDSDEEAATRKRPRVSWSPELHSKFICAVNKLGIDRAVPKKILDLMKVSGLTRENIASHLQKYRKALRKNSNGSEQKFYGAAHADEFPVNPRSFILSSDEQSPGSFLLEQYKFGTHPSHGRIIPFDHASYAYSTNPLFPLSPNHQDILHRGYPSISQTSQTTVHSFGHGSDLSIMGIPGRQTEFNGLSNQLLPSRPNQHDGYLQNLSFWACGGGGPTRASVPLSPFTSNKESLDVLLDKSSCQQEETHSSFSAELDSILSLHHEQQDIQPSTGADPDLGNDMWSKNEDSSNRTAESELWKLLSKTIVQHNKDDSLGDLDAVLKQSSSERFLNGTGQAELMKHPVDYSSKETIFQFSKCDSEDDLHAMLKQVRACS